ncbi:PA14 domain-containing protein [uncultured Victivallis sp.]|uniref:PA14 domain-containing protein n=1 Tax=uncultured Victivallis sp. TaxID=354118 RepID=UPI0025CE3678|nr:PA14 domain-containing protein [uncultured Victivallis sp.]
MRLCRDSPLKLAPDQFLHHGAFCRYHKTHQGLGECSRNKARSIEIARREGHINFLRYHRFNLQNWPVAACDDAGIVSEGEGPWWGLFAPTDINGENNCDDPVWLENCFEYYTKIMRKFRNSPSMLFFSLENETMTAANSRTVKKFRERAQAEAPHMILMNHSHSSALAPEAPVAVLHDYDLGVNRIREYCSLAEKPVVIGEFWNPEVSNALYNPQQARGAERLMKLWLERLVKSYYKAGVDGVMPYTFTGLGAIASKRDSRSCGPWSEYYTAAPQKVFSRPVVWPSMSGSGGIRAEKLYLDNMTLRRGPVNFFDPERPAYTPTAVMEAYRNIFQPLPELAIRRSPELLVEVVRNGKPVPHENVFSTSESGGPQGVQADAQGRAWFYYDLPGRQTISVTAEGKTLTHEVELVCIPLGKPGWEYLPKLRFDLGTGSAEFTPGNVDLGDTAADATSRKETPVSLRRPKSAFAKLAPVGPTGFIRRWLVLGPFPNYGSRKKRTAQWMNTDFLGGETTIHPSLALPPQQVEFKRNPKAYWEPGRFTIRWDWLTSDKDVVDLSGAFLIDHPGLDGIIQYIFGYAACYVKSDSDRDAVLTIGSDDGYKIFLNGGMVGALQAYRGCKPDENRHSVRLKKGWNRLLVKIEQETGGYAFALRFLDSGGKPLLLETSLTPPATGTALQRGKFLRDWMVIGPFPNVGERPKCSGFRQDFLGGEAAAVPEDQEIRTEFPAYEKAYYEAGTLVNRWKPCRSSGDRVDLGNALLRSDVPGLDVSPLQYVAGYAATTVDVPAAGEYTLELSTFNGVRVWLNGTLLIDDHNHTFNRDPNSPVLPPSFRKTLKRRVSLRPGENRLLVKLDVDYGPLDFSLKFD